MDQDIIKQGLQNVNSQIPNPYTSGVWYDVILPNNKPGQARRTKPGYLNIRKLTHFVIKLPDGTITQDGGMQYVYYRCNLMTGDIKEL